MSHSQSEKQGHNEACHGVLSPALHDDDDEGAVVQAERSHLLQDEDKEPCQGVELLPMVRGHFTRRDTKSLVRFAVAVATCLLLAFSLVWLLRLDNNDSSNSGLNKNDDVNMNSIITGSNGSSSISNNNSNSDSLDKSSQLDFATSLSQCRHASGQCYLHLVHKTNGLGSQLMALFTSKLYMTQTLNVSMFLVDQVHYENYQRSNNQQVLQGYFTPTFPIRDRNTPHSKDIRNAINSLLPPDMTLTDWLHASREEQYLATNTSHHLMLGDTYTFRTDMKHVYYVGPGNINYDQMYLDLIPHMCESLQWNDEAHADINALHQQYNIPNDFDASATVTFHVRRTDKVTSAESQMYPAGNYVDKILTTVSDAETKLRYCFLATDDYAVVDEMQQALNEAGMTCTLLFTSLSGSDATNPGDTSIRYEAEAALVFMSELDMMLRSTYFVGTFSSNVASLVAVLRACPNRNHPVHDHYARSYGVDSDQWRYR